MNDFERDNAWQLRMRDEILGPNFYGPHSLGGRYVFIDKGRLTSTLQQRYAVDTIVQTKEGRAVCIEEKIVRWPKNGQPHTAFALETESCTVDGHESPGWMRYGKADFLLYCFQTAEDDLDCYLMKFPELQAWFFTVDETYPRFGPLSTLNRTQGRVVPIADVFEAGVWIRRVPVKRPHQK